MSAKSIKQDRLAASEAKRDRKLREAQEAEKAKAKARTGWIVGSVIAVLAVVLMIFVNTGLIYRCTTALKINDKSYSPAELNYFYGNEYISVARTYGSYASYFGYTGLDTSAGISSLKNQAYPSDEYANYKEFFLDAAKKTILANQPLYDYAVENGVSLSDKEIAEIDSSFASLEQSVLAGGWKSLDNYFASSYGNGVTVKVARECQLFLALAQKGYEHASEQFEYTDEELAAYYDSLEGESDKYNYWYYYLAAETVESEPDADGNTTSSVTDETLAAAQQKADNIVNAFNARIPEDGIEGDSVCEAYFNSAISSQVSAECTAMKNTSASSVNSDYKDWVTDGQRSFGDITVVANSSGTGYNLVVFGSHDDNHYPTVSVRHILIKAAEDENGSFTDEAVAEAEAKAEEILAQWKAGEATEESFAALAEEFSEDGGSNTNGGLYENIYKGQMVDSFDEFCFAGHKYGDTAIVTATSGNYAGAHIIYYVGEGELYSNYIARQDMLEEDVSAWYDSLKAGYELKEGPAYNLAG
ncbi:MAG: peptidylprolyl isomerase [Oscillospiraceae bacterium]|nr:peptidylprolyl isomerase [Oscillospiraceae bacterium]